jgi:hypothetical protein
MNAIARICSVRALRSGGKVNFEDFKTEPPFFLFSIH